MNEIEERNKSIEDELNKKGRKIEQELPVEEENTHEQNYLKKSENLISVDYQMIREMPYVK
uniref:Uncharacterized protein n=1 Tax=Cucumis melo TaxID=3656 RepID=A0A9I9EJY4_CUCME